MRRQLAILAVTAYALLLGWLSLIPLQTAAPEGSDKLGHAFAYLIFMLLAAQVVKSLRGRRWAAASIVGFGIMLEFAQGATTYRSMSAADALANTIGVLLALGLIALWNARRFRDV